MNRLYCHLTLLVLLTAQLPPVLAQQVAFEKGAWKDMLARARSENKLIFVDVYTTWCGPCKMLDQQVFTNKKVAATYNAHFINYKADAERGEGINLARQYGVRAYPTALFINGDGQLIDTWVGFLPADSFKQEGERVFRKTPIGITLSLYDADYKEGNRESVFMRNYLRLRQHLGINTVDVLNEYVSHLPADSLLMSAIVSLLLEHTTVCQGSAFAVLLSRRNEPRFNAAIQSLIQSELNTAGTQRNKSLFASVCRVVEQVEPADQVAERLAEYQLVYLATAEEWKAYAEQALSYTTQYLMPGLTPEAKQQRPKQFQARHDQLCNIGYFMTHHSRDNAQLSAILVCLTASGQLDTTPLNTSLEACLRYRMGERDEAVALQTKALELARSSGDNAASYEATLQRMQRKKAL